MITTTLRNVPDFLKSSKTYLNLIEDYADTENEEFDTFIETYKQDTIINSIDDLNHMLITCDYWFQDDLPIEVFQYLKDNLDKKSDIVKCRFREELFAFPSAEHYIDTENIYMLDVVVELDIWNFITNFNELFIEVFRRGKLNVAIWLLSNYPTIDISMSMFDLDLNNQSLEVAKWIFEIIPEIFISFKNYLNIWIRKLTKQSKVDKVFQWMYEVEPDIFDTLDIISKNKVFFLCVYTNKEFSELYFERFSSVIMNLNGFINPISYEVYFNLLEDYLMNNYINVAKFLLKIFHKAIFKNFVYNDIFPDGYYCYTRYARNSNNLLKVIKLIYSMEPDYFINLPDLFFNSFFDCEGYKLWMMETFPTRVMM